MNAWVLFLLAILLLLLPRILLPGKARQPCRQSQPELDAPLRLLHGIMIAYCALWYRLKNNGWAPLPETGPALLIANHTCGIDHMVLQASSRRILGFIIAREYYDWNLIHWFCWRVGCIPVNRDGRDLQALRTALRALKQGRVVPIFPEGRITPRSGRELGEMLPGAAYLALRAGVPVYPAYIRGTPETNQIGPSLRTPSHAFVTFGPPIDLSDLGPKHAGDKEAQAEVSRRFRAALLELQARSHNGTTVYRCAGLSEPVALE